MLGFVRVRTGFHAKVGEVPNALRFLKIVEVLPRKRWKEGALERLRRQRERWIRTKRRREGGLAEQMHGNAHGTSI